MCGRRLALRRESLAELTSADLSFVGGAEWIPPWTPVIHTLPYDRCLYTVLDCAVATVGC